MKLAKTCRDWKPFCLSGLLCLSNSFKFRIGIQMKPFEKFNVLQLYCEVSEQYSIITV